MKNILIIDPNHSLSLESMTVLEEYNIKFKIEDDFRKLKNRAGYELYRISSYDAILIDLNIDNKKGLVICNKIRHYGFDKSIFAFDSVDDLDYMKFAIQNGADEYIKVPISNSELIYRIVQSEIKKEIKHDQIKVPIDIDFNVNKDIITHGLITIDKSKMEVFYNDIMIQLTRKEYELFLILAESFNKVLSKDELKNELYGSKSVKRSSIDFLINRIRNKLDRIHNCTTIKTVVGIGYIYC